MDTEVMHNSGKSKHRKKKQHWGKEPKRIAIIAGIAALLGILLDIFAVVHYSDEVDWSNALQVTSEAEVSELQDYTGRVIIQGPLTGTPYTFDEAYGNVEMKKSVEVDGSFLVSKLVVSDLEEYVKNQEKVKQGLEQPEYDVHYRHHGYYEQAESLNLYGLPIDRSLLDTGYLGGKDYGELYRTVTQYASLKVIEGPEADVVLQGEMENGTIVSGNVYVNGTIDEAISDSANSLMVFHVILAVWLLLCGFVIWSMYQQRHKNKL